MNIKGRSGSVLIIALVVAVVLAAAGGMWYWSAHKSSPAQPTPSINSSVTENDNAGSASSTIPASAAQSVAPRFDNGQFSFQYPSDFLVATATDGEIVLWDKATYAQLQIPTATREEQCKKSVDVPGPYAFGECANPSPVLSMQIVSQSFSEYSANTTSAIASGENGDSIMSNQDVMNAGFCLKGGVAGLLTYWSGEFALSYSCAVPLGNQTLILSWDAGNIATSTVQGIVNTLQSTSTALTITPISGPAGTMIVLNGKFSVCGNQIDQCTEDRFDQPVFLQNGVAVATSVVPYSPMEGSGTANDPFRQNGNTAYQVPLSLMPGNYEFAMQNCLGKGCNNYHISWFTVVAPGSAAVPTIGSINPQTLSKASLAGATITIHGNNFSTSDNYISFLGDGTTGSTVGYSYIADVASPDGKTIILKLPSCSASSGPTCEWVPAGAYWSFDNGYRIAVSNSNGTSNFASLKTQ